MTRYYGSGEYMVAVDEIWAGDDLKQDAVVDVPAARPPVRMTARKIIEMRDREWMDALEEKYGKIVETKSVGMIELPDKPDPYNGPEMEQYRIRDGDK